MAAKPVVVPPALRPGSVVRVVAPSGPFDPRLVWRGLGFLAQRYRVRYARGIFERRGYLAGSDARRREELESALHEPDVAAVVCARGGYGLSRYVETIDWSVLRREPRWLVGFSDVTAIHVEASRQAVASMHAPNLTALGRSDHETRAAWIDALESPQRARRFSGLAGLVQGRATGPLFGGNLSMLHACAAAGRLVVPRGAVLLIEDVGEWPYRIDRMLSTLRAGGYLDGLSGIVAGQFDACRAGSDGVGVDQVLAERLADLGIPIATRLPVGHGRHNAPLILGANATIDVSGNSATLSLGS